MKLETFFEKFDLFADMPGAVGKLRELVLYLAFQGLLVPSDEQSRVWKPRKIKELATKIGSGSTPSGGKESYQLSGVPLIRSMNVYFGGFVRDGLVFLNDEQAEKLKNVTVEPNDVLLNITGASIGRVTTAPDDMQGARVNQHVCIIRPKSEILSRFLEMFLASPLVQNLIDEIQVGATREALTKGMIEQFEVPLPSLAEQRRIVTKVNELMAMCDQLEAQLRERQTQHAALARSALARFAEAPTPAKLEFLFHPSFDIAPADLRKSILSLAMQGKLCDTGIDNWHETNLGNVIELISGQHLLENEHNSEGRGIPYLTGPSDFGAKNPAPTRWTELPKVISKPGDILITVKGSGIGKTNILVDEPTAISRQLMAIRVTGADRDFVHLALTRAAEHFQRAKTGIAIPGIGRREVLELPITLPPLAEQRRIVAKVNELMALVDALESQLAAARERAATLLAAAVAELIQGTKHHAAA